MGGSRRVAVAGANGKTTTTSMLVVALVAAGADPSFASGGEIAQLGTNAALGGGPAFVVEADESDGSFLAYRPDVAVVTNVQPDHLDFYGTRRGGRGGLRRLRRLGHRGRARRRLPRRPGVAPPRRRRPRAAGRTVLTYGHVDGADLRVGEVRSAGLGTRSVFVHDGVERVLDLAVPGDHNVMDACAAYLAAVVGLGADPEAVLAGLAGFGGARRRFEVRGEVDGVTVVDDYAHNPAKVAAVVGTAADIVRRAGHGSLRVVFQPHLYSRTRDFAAEFAAALAPADQVVLLDVYGAREQPVEGITSALVGDPLRALPGQRTVLVGPDPRRGRRGAGRRGPTRRPPAHRRGRRRHRPRPARRRRACAPAPEGRPDEPRHHTPPRRRPRASRPRPTASASGRCRTAAAPGAGRCSSCSRRADGGPARLGRRLEHLARRRRGRGHRRHRARGAGRRPARRGAGRHPAGPGRHRGRRRPGARAGDGRRGVGAPVLAGHAHRRGGAAQRRPRGAKPSGST